MLNIKTKLRRAFTIVELVVVIAVIAALAAILIPTFANVIKSANESADTSLVKNLNTIFSSEQTVTSSKPSTMSEALELAADNGYNIENLTPSSSGDIVWDQTSNRFLLIDEEGNIVYQDGTTSEDVVSAKYQLWYIASSEESYTAAVEEGYSVYLNYTVETSAEAPLNVTAGVDVGDNEEVYISYTSTATQTVIFNTNGATLTINNSNADVYHYGTAQTVTITAVASSSYHLYGEVKGTLELKKGHLEIESSASISYVHVSATSSSNVSITNSSSNSIEISATSSNMASNVASGVSGATAVETAIDETLSGYFAGGAGTEANPFQISTSQQFSNIYYVSNNYSTYGYSSADKVYYKLINDITLNTYLTFSNTITTYGGLLWYSVLDGGGYTLTATAVNTKYSDNNHYLFYQIAYSEFKNVTVVMGNNTLSMTYYLYGTSTLTKVDATGDVMFPSGNYGLYSIYTYDTITFNSCTNYVNVTGYGDLAAYNAIFVGYNYTTWGLTLTFNDCANKGSIVCGKAAMFIANLCASTSTGTIIINNCVNDGEIRSTYQSYTPDYYIASGGVYSKGTFTLDGTTYTSATAVPTLDKVYQGPNDTTNIAINDDGYFYITESGIGSADTYVISIGLYTNVYSDYGGGTTRYYVKLTVSKDDFTSGKYVSNLQKLKFIDLATYLTKTGAESFDGTESDTVKAVGDGGYMVCITEGEGDSATSTWYYLINSEQCYLSNQTASATIFCVSVFNSNNKLLSSTSI